MSSLKALLERKVVQWTLGYLVGAFGFLEALGFLADLFGWPLYVVRGTAVLLASGAFAVLVFSWHHGARGAQRITRTETGLLGAIGLAGIVGAVLLGPLEQRSLSDAAALDPTAAAERSVAVLPPVDLSGTPEYFAAGMHDALISQLSRVGALRVISRTSSAAYAGSDKAIPEIARELGVDDVVETAVARSGDSVRIEVRLVRAVPSESMLWSGTFTTAVENVLPLHADLARSIAREVQVDLTPDERRRLASSNPVDPETYEAYLRGMHALTQGTPASIQEGLAHLHGAVDRNPGDALAYAGLALGYANLGHSPSPPPEAWPRASEAAERAVTLDPELAEAHAALADVKLYYEWDWEGAEREFRTANELNPSLAMNRYHYAWYLILFDRLDEALVQHRLAKELDPLTPLHTAWLGGLYLQFDPPRVQEALDEARASLELQPDAVAGLLVLGRVYAETGRFDEAVAAHRRLAEIAPPARWMLGVTYARAGMTQEAERIRDELAEGNPGGMDALGLVALNTALGDLDRAFGWMRYRPHHAWLPWLRTNPWARPLRSDPRFDEFLLDLGLPPPAPQGRSRGGVRRKSDVMDGSIGEAPTLHSTFGQDARRTDGGLSVGQTVTAVDGASVERATMDDFCRVFTAGPHTTVTTADGTTWPIGPVTGFYGGD